MKTKAAPAGLYSHLDDILGRAFPQGARLLKHEAGGAIMHLGARDLIENARLAVEVLGARGAKALGRALVAIGHRYSATIWMRTARQSG
jgi:hypothetical protein